MTERVLTQCRLFNEGVRTGDWAGYLDRFGDTATLRIEGDPGSPYVGRDAIAAAYSAAPPDDTLNVTSVDSAGDEDVARVAWSAGGAGTLRVRWSAGRIAELSASFDAPA
ncbi:nuclear transport factor 2 family protein [Dactylosporangium sp. NPDC000244]|uniref:nuclear transport factor 2 family protein n=1 Tax=Dactylosporangium sp. NPDC000244 TaxID=3154365 RepID=UPI00331911B7